MSNAFARRFQQLVDQLASGNKKRFAEVTGKSASHVYKICRGNSRPSMVYLQRLFDEFNIDLNWLLTGERSDEQSGVANNPSLVFAPLFDVQASAGGGVMVQGEEIAESFGFNKQWLSSQLNVSSDKLAFVTVSGDSMQPTLDDGDMILADLSTQQVYREGIYLLQTEDGLLSKRLKAQANGHIEVISDNAAYPNWTLSDANSEQAQVVGKVVWFGRKVH